MDCVGSRRLPTDRPEQTMTVATARCSLTVDLCIEPVGDELLGGERHELNSMLGHAKPDSDSTGVVMDPVIDETLDSDRTVEHVLVSTGRIVATLLIGRPILECAGVVFGDQGTELAGSGRRRTGHGLGRVLGNVEIGRVQAKGIGIVGFGRAVFKDNGKGNLWGGPRPVCVRCDVVGYGLFGVKHLDHGVLVMTGVVVVRILAQGVVGKLGRAVHGASSGCLGSDCQDEILAILRGIDQPGNALRTGCAFTFDERVLVPQHAGDVSVLTGGKAETGGLDGRDIIAKGQGDDGFVGRREDGRLDLGAEAIGILQGKLDGEQDAHKSNRKDQFEDLRVGQCGG